MASYYLTVFQQPAVYLACLYLSAMRTHLLNAIEERFYSAVKRLKRHGTEKIKTIYQMPSVNESLDAVGTHELSAVKKGKTPL